LALFAVIVEGSIFTTFSGMDSVAEWPINDLFQDLSVFPLLIETEPYTFL
jgi:hypothetical protein